MRGRTVQVAIRAMVRYKLRTVFMMLGSVVGVATLTLAVSIGQGVQAKMLRTVRQVVGDSSILVLAGGNRLMGGPRADLARLTTDDIDAVAKAVPEVQAWDPQQDLVMPVKYRDATTTVRLLGESVRAEQVWGRTVADGRFFDATDVKSAALVALIGETAARALFAGDNPVGAEIRVGSVPLRIVGVLERYGVDMHGMDRDNEIVVPLSTFSRRLTNTDNIAAARLVVADPTRADETSRDIRRVLRERHALAASQPDDFQIVNPVAVRRMVATIERILFVYVPLVAGVALIVGAIVSAVLMLSSVQARVAEIGVRRATGARPADIRLQFLVETAVTTIGGGLVGMAIGYSAASILAIRMQLGGAFSWRALLVGFAASAATGVLAGVLPARRAALLQPVDALRQR